MTITADQHHINQENNACYVRNMAALWQWDAPLAAALEEIPQECIYPLEQARDGSYTARRPSVAGEGPGGVYLHSRYKPRVEAENWAAAVPPEKWVIIVNGFGLGYHVAALYKKLPEDALVIVAEPNLAMIKTALHAADMSDMLKDGRVVFFTAIDRGDLVNRLELRTSLLALGVHFTMHKPSADADPEFHRQFQKLINDYAAYARTSFLTLMLNSDNTCKNIANNIGRYVTTPPIDSMRQAFAGRPAILVAAGPSLQKNMHLLHEVKAKDDSGGKAVIIAVQTMLKPLIAAGIEPDFVTSLDYNTVSTRFFENLSDAGTVNRVHLVAEPKANWNVLDVFDGSMSLLGNEFAAQLLREASPPRDSLKAGATVAHLSFYLAEYLGCNPIILVGQDLGFVDGLYYKPGTAIHETWGVELGRFNSLETKEWERIVRSRSLLRKIPDIHGHPMYTEEQFFVYLQQFERDFAESRSTVIDATEGGARKQGVVMMTLRDAIDRYCGNDLGAIPRPWKTPPEHRADHLRSALEALSARQKCTQDMADICDQTVPLLEEMIVHQQDAAKMNELFIKVDRMRAKVGQDEITMKMVTQLNPIGELNRFKADLRMRLVPKDTPEYQKRQLERDIEYVHGLRVGCVRLLGMIDGAIGRLKIQLESVELGKAWPRDVAGAQA